MNNSSSRHAAFDVAVTLNIDEDGVEMMILILVLEGSCYTTENWLSRYSASKKHDCCTFPIPCMSRKTWHIQLEGWLRSLALF